MKETDSEEKESFPTSFQRRTLWTAITALAIVVIGSIAVGGIYLTGKVLAFLQPVLVPIAVAGITAYLLHPVILWLRRKMRWKYRTCMIIVFSAFMGLLIWLGVAVIIPSVGQAQKFIKERDNYQAQVTELVMEGVGDLQERLKNPIAREYYDRGIEWLGREGPEISRRFGLWLWERIQGAFGFIGFLLGLLLVPVYLFFFLHESHKIKKEWSNYLPIRASAFKDEVVDTLKEVNQYLISFFRGQMVVSLIDGALIALALSFLKLPYALLIGVFLAILGLIPFIGNLLVMIPAALIALGHFGAKTTATVVGNVVPTVGSVMNVRLSSGEIEEKYITEVFGGKSVEVLAHAWTWLPNMWFYPLIVIVIFIVLQQINGLVTAPKIVGDSVGLHPITVIFSVLFWSFLLGGLLGALLAVPLTASLKVLFRRYVWEKRIEPRVGPFGGENSPENREPGPEENGAELTDT